MSVQNPQEIEQLLDLYNLDRHLVERSITRQKHPTLPLFIYNYTPAVQYTPELWDNETEMCRGLIVSGDGEVVARPFRKFFNLDTSFRPETHSSSLPTSRPQVMEKMDGSLGILYEYAGEVGIATRGSFTSPQAEWATRWYKEHLRVMQEATNGMGVVWLKDYTPLFEIIYPENRIVCRYDFSGLVLIGLVNKTTGEELPYEDLQFGGLSNSIRVASLYDKTLEEAVADKGKGNDEGFVVTWFDPYIKVKVKFEEYCRLHRVLTGMNTKTVWEMMRDNEFVKLMELVDDKTLPKEFRDWLWTEFQLLWQSYIKIFLEARKAIHDYPDYDFMFESRKHFVMYLMKATSTDKRIFHIAMAMLDGKDHEPMIWKLIKPVAAKPFTEE